ncbi:MAG: T9SS type A sorting domain-containing protein [Sphingobacteriales bacterium]|nr:MAG: T9SS type A sorting domain-containing protein [Sphingobacteriales bacterium]
MNDFCANAITLTSGATCTPVAGTVNNATNSTGPPAACLGTPVYDVWYRFTAQTTNPVISLTGIGAGFVNPKIQVLAGTCAALTNITSGCGLATTIETTPLNLIVGNSYYVRVFSTDPIPLSNGDFNICITDPVVPVNNSCAGATLLTSSTVYTPIPGTVVNATLDGAAAACAGTVKYDVWYTFVAQSVNPIISLTNPGANFVGPRIELFTGSCGSLTSIHCNTAAATATTQLNLTIGTTYTIRVISTNTNPSPNTTGGFDIGIVDRPSNDLCINAIPLTSGATCTPVAGTVNNASISAGSPTACLGTPLYDVWYSFTAQTTNPVISLSGIGAGFLNPKIQVLGGNCAALTTVTNGCALASTIETTALNLIVGNTYFVRVFSTDPIPTANGDFSICITDPIVPVNNSCAAATLLTSSTVYTPIAGTVVNATADAVATCAGTVKYDVWYTFVAQSVNPIISLTTPGANFTAPRIEVFTGACGSLTSIHCNTAAVIATTALNLTIGTTYTVRVFSTTTNPIPNINGGFDIGVIDRPLNDYCANAIALTSGATCVPVTGTVNNATPSAPLVAHCGTGTVRYDVWYSFVAQSVNPSIALTNIGAGFLDPRVQVFSGTCGSLTQIACNTAAIMQTHPLNLIVGNTYYIRLYTLTNPIPVTDGNFDICITDPVAPTNDEPVGAINLVSDATCVPTAGNVGNATYNIAAGATACAGIDQYDVWYTFTAQRLNPTITITGANATYFNTPKIQLFTGTPGSLVSVACSNAPYTGSALTLGQVYYVRVYTTNVTPLPNATFGGFNICITDPPIPINDDCAAATDLVPSTTNTCGATTPGNLMNANSSTGIPGDCGNAASPDVWYKFVASSPYHEVRVSGAGAQLTTSGLRVQILDGSCGSFINITCNRSTTNSLTTVPTGAGFTIGQTYYVRVYSNAPTTAQTASTWNFNICIATPPIATYHYGKTYANITKGSGGGTIEPGDELEIRAVFNLRGNSIYNASYSDIIPANTTYVPGTLRILTNEGKIWRQWTDAADGDPGTITGSNVTINLGKDASETSGGLMKQGDKPGSVIMVSFRVNVNSVPFGTVLQLGGGTFNFNVSDPVNPAIVIAYGPTPAMVYQNYGICTNTIGTNGILSEYGGTFGSGTTKNRESSGKVPANYTYARFTTNAPGDYFYGVSNNTSSDSLANYSINPNDPIGSTTRVYNIWDIIGDHTGASDPLAGNLPADVNNGATGGYMVVINAAYRADTAFQDTVRNLCPNTSYEYSAWFRNICRKCGVDSNGVQALNAGYIPTGPGDSSGVHPNLTFNINGHDYYTTGDMAYTGQWVKKGFTYRTGPTETEMVIFIRNNAPGGGGNDWAIDDIGVATCSPTLVTNPDSSVVGICYGDGRALSAQVISYYDNFTHWIWEKSVDSGTTWLGTGYAGNTIPALVSGNYEYTATGPAVPGDSATHRNQFRLRVASSADNLSDINCSFRAIRTIQIMVNNCMYVLKTRVTALTGKLEQGYGKLSWTGANEEPGLVYIVEKSTNGSGYKAIATIKGKTAGGIAERYVFTDPEMLKSATYYRVLVKEENGQEYTRVVLLSPSRLDIEIRNLINPFYQQVSFDLITPAEGNARITVIDQFGRIVKTTNEHVHAGINPLQISNFGVLSNGVYTLKVEIGNKAILKRIAKVQL